MGQNYSVEDSEVCTPQDNNPLMVFGKQCMTDGKKVGFYVSPAVNVNRALCANFFQCS